MKKIKELRREMLLSIFTIAIGILLVVIVPEDATGGVFALLFGVCYLINTIFEVARLPRRSER